tara:strand:- start:59 stop:304 length:246 start_codon:yes stop_codon:yes gene_type:complete
MTLRSKVREHRLIKFPISKLEEELLAIKSLSKVNKDLRNRARRLEKVIEVKKYAAIKVTEKIEKALEKQTKPIVEYVDVSK